MNIVELKAKARDLHARVDASTKLCEDGSITVKEFKLRMEDYKREDAELAKGFAAVGGAMQYASAASPAEHRGAQAPNGPDTYLTFKGAADAFVSQVAPDGLRTKAVGPSGAAVVAQEFQPSPVSLGQPAQSLLDVVPARGSGPEFAYLRQSVRVNNAAVVADYALKPTSVYTVERIEDSLKVIAHLSEPVPRFWLVDNDQLRGWIATELMYGLRVAVEQSIIAAVNAVSGTVAQAYSTSVLATLRKSLTALEINGYDPGFIVVHPTVWEGVELALASVNAIEYQGIPYDAASRRLFGVPVVLNVREAVGVGHVFAKDAVALNVGEGTSIMWNESSEDLFTKNLVLARCEGRYATSVFKPGGVVIADLTP